MSFDPISYAMGKQAGGGNPNRVETITGTVANPFGELDFAELYRELGNGGVTLILSALGASMMGQRGDGGSILFGTALFTSPIDDAPWIGGSTLYFSVGETAQMDYAKVLQNGVWVDLPATTPTVLTVIRHPLPEEG